MADWLTLLRDEVGRTSQRSAAARVGVSATTVCQVLKGSYTASPARIAARVEEVLGRVECPHTGESLEAGECARRRGRPMPTHSPEAMRAWRACRGCEQRQRETGDG